MIDKCFSCSGGGYYTVINRYSYNGVDIGNRSSRYECTKCLGSGAMDYVRVEAIPVKDSEPSIKIPLKQVEEIRWLLHIAYCVTNSNFDDDIKEKANKIITKLATAWEDV